MLNLSRFIKGEFIGKEVEVDGAGISGIVIDETKNTLLIMSGNGRKSVQKRGRKFIFKVLQNRIRIDGSDIVLRPEDRIKMRFAKKWKAEILD